MWKKFAVAVLVFTFAGLAYGEAQRPLFTKENALPDKGHVEVGSLFTYQEFDGANEVLSADDSDAMTVAPYVRIGLLDNLSAHVMVPFKEIDRNSGGDDSGIGDVVAGFELVAFEDIFDYPYVIPHLDLRFDTGDEKEGLGAGESAVLFGISVGTVVEDAVHFIIDATYEVLDDSDNIISFAGTVIWDISDQFSVLAEAKITDEVMEPDDGDPVYLQGGMTYKATEALAFSVYGGSVKNTSEDVNAGGKISYSF